MAWLDRLLGIIPILGGVYGVLIAYRVIPINRKDPQKAKLWHERFGTMMKILSPIVIISGILIVLGII